MGFLHSDFDSIIENMINAFAYHKMITDASGNHIDYEFIEVNKAFEIFTGLKRDLVVGKRVTEVIPDIKSDEFNWIDFYGKVALNGISASIEQYSNVLKRWYLINAYSPQKEYFITVFIDISNIKQRENELCEKNDELSQLYEEITASEEELRVQVEELDTFSKRLAKSESRLNRAQAIAHVGNWEIDLMSGQIWGSEEAFKLYGLERKTPFLPLKTVQTIVHPQDRPTLDQALKLLIEQKEKYDVEFRIIRPDNGEERYMHSVAELEIDSNGRPVSVLGVIRDITERTVYERELKSKNEELSSLYEEIMASEEELRQQLDEIQAHREQLLLSKERYKILVNNSKDIIYSYDGEGVFTAVNHMFCEVFGVSEHEAIGKKISQVIDDSDYVKKCNEARVQVCNTLSPCYFQNTYTMKDGTLRHYDITLSPVFDGKRRIVGITGTNHDMTEIRKNQKLIRHMAYHDPLTGLANRTLLKDRLNTAIVMAKRMGMSIAVAFIDLDNFKKVNDTLGHVVGDELLIDASKRIQFCVREYDTVSRLSGDEFCIIIQNINQQVQVDVLPIMERINTIFCQPFEIDGHSIRLTASIGISIYPHDGETVGELLRNADTAMYKAKELGRNTYCFFNNKMRDELVRKTNIERMLRKALENNEFLLYYQPQYETKTGQLRGFEALIRWNSAEAGFMSPADFIPIAEETGLIVEIGQWVLNTACRLCKKIENKYQKSIIISVNISPIQLRHKEFINMVLDAVKLSEISFCKLELEITENHFIDNADEAIGVLKKLREAGIRIALDDFGTGYSSLSYLKKLPINLLKIDKSFVDEIDCQSVQQSLTSSIITLVHNLNIETIAEGIETCEQYEYLLESKCDNLQGYYLGKPVPEHLVDEVIKNHWKV